MEKIYNFDTPIDYGKCTLILRDNSITISRTGFMAKMKYGHVGDRTILLNQITAVEFKPAKLAMGYIQFVLAGTMVKKQPIFASQKERADDNTIMFSKKEKNDEALEIKNYIEQYNLKNLSGSTNIINQKSSAEQIKEFKELLDEGIITKEEFEAKKKELLDL